jgi:hypothetical protein
MPGPGHGEFTGGGRLSKEQVALLARQVKQGMPQGDAAQTTPMPRFPKGWQTGEPDLVLHMRAPRLLPAEKGVFRNFILPVDLQDNRYIRAVEMRPRNKPVVNHANFIVERPPQMRRRDGNADEPDFPAWR